MSTRKANGEGTIYKRYKKKNGKKIQSGWAGQITIGIDPNTGKPKRKTFYGKTKPEVSEKMVKVLNELNQGTYIEPTEMAIGKWLDIWLLEYAKQAVKQSTFVSYEMICRKHIKPYIGKIKLKKLQTATVQSLYNQKTKDGLSPKTVKNIHNVLHKALDQAFKNQLIIRNPSEATTLPKITNKQMRVLTLKEQQKVMEEAQKEYYGFAIIFDLGTGLRLGELLALTWDDIDMKRKFLYVNKAINRLKTFDKNSPTKTKLMLQTTKTKSGERKVPIPENLIYNLKRIKERQIKDRFALKKSYENNNLVFCNGFGKYVEPRNMIRTFHRVVKKANIEHANFHCLRHTFATRLLEVGEHPKVVQEILGHSTIQMTLDTYSHVLEDTKQAAAQKINNLFFKAVN